MSYSWKDISEGWCVPLRDFVGCEEAILCPFDPFERLVNDNEWLSVDPFVATKLPGLPEFSVHLLKSRVPHLRMSAVMVNRGVRVGYVTRRAAGCDVICVAPEFRGKGIAQRLLLTTRELRASLEYKPIESLRLASKHLFCGGSYSTAGLATARSAHREAVRCALARGKAVPEEVLADYPELSKGYCS